MKIKTSLFTFLLIFFSNGLRSQIITHGGSLNKLYYIDSIGQLNKLTNGELWITYDDSGARNGFSFSTGVTFAPPQSDLDIGDIPPLDWPAQEQISCSYARWIFGKTNVSCLPWVKTGWGYLDGYCSNQSANNACWINFGAYNILSPSGDFQF